MHEYDIAINHGLYFDGSGESATLKHLAIKDGRIAAVSEHPFTNDCALKVIDASGHWITPGFIDTHTHYDAEIATQKGILVVDLFLDLVVEYGTQLRWYTTVANHRPNVLKKLIKNSRSLITFSDAGAHIRNMAFYNLPLRLLQLVKDSQADNNPVMSLEQAVFRMTGDQADWFGIDAGRIRVGDRADVVVLDPEGLAQDLEAFCWAEMENFEIQRLVNRNPGLVKHVIVNGKLAVENERLCADVGKQTGFGSFIPACTSQP